LKEKLLNDLIKKIFGGTLKELPLFLYLHNIVTLNTAITGGFGNIKGNIPAIEKAANFRENVGRFSGAKTYQTVKTLTEAVFMPDGSKLPFAQYKKIARDINHNFNTLWLETERDTVFTQSQNARKELKFEAEKEVFPLVEYKTVADERVRPSHKKLDGIILPVNDLFWDKNSPQNGYKCRCIKIQHRRGKVTGTKELKERSGLIDSEFKKDGLFAYNAGKQEYIFKETGKDKHPYFLVGRKAKPELAKNFGFPDIKTIKE